MDGVEVGQKYGELTFAGFVGVEDFLFLGIECVAELVLQMKQGDVDGIGDTPLGIEFEWLAHVEDLRGAETHQFACRVAADIDAGYRLIRRGHECGLRMAGRKAIAQLLYI